MTKHTEGKWGRPTNSNGSPYKSEAERMAVGAQRGHEANLRARGLTPEMVAQQKKGIKTKQQWCYLCNDSHDYHMEDDVRQSA